MFQTLVNQRNGLVLLLDAVNRDASLVVCGVRLINGNVVDRFPEAVMQFERLPIWRETGRKAQFVNFQL